MILRLALRNLSDRPWRSALLFLGYGIGVGVMIVLLSIGDALVDQSRDVELVGGGEVTVLPEGVDVEVMKTGGIGGLFTSIDHARFVYRQLLAAPRHADVIRAVAPQLTERLVYVGTHDGREIPVRASGGIPSRDALVRAAPAPRAGRWRDDDGDRAWIAPTRAELYGEIDHFHRPPAALAAAAAESWGEWHYFNVLSPDGRHWAFISLIVGGDVRGTVWGGRVTVTLRDLDGATRRFSATVDRRRVRFSVRDADLALGPSTVTLLPDGRYRVHVEAREDGSGAPLRADLSVAPAPYAYFPAVSLGGDGFVSGYAVPGLRADASGTMCVAGRCTRYVQAQSYHDHNWGTWQDITWEWGEARAGAYTLLYGLVRTPGGGSAVVRPLFLYLVDSLGMLGTFRPARIEYVDGRRLSAAGRSLAVPSSATISDARDGDTIRVQLTIQDAIATSIGAGGPAVRAPGAGRRSFVQMKGRAHVSGRVGGRPIDGSGDGFFETFR